MTKLGEASNKDAERIVGLRNNGKPSQPLFMPHELGYACPICNASNEVELAWSEYEGFIYCYTCKLDIPSCISVCYYEPKLSNKKMTKREKVEKQVKIYLSCIKEAQKEKHEI